MIDLRSDTLTQPSEEMLKMILLAQTGDAGREDEYGRGEDKTVNELEDFAAQLTGKESAAFFPSGTLANTTAILTYCKPGDKVLVDEKQHILLSEKVVFDSRFGQLLPIKFKLAEDGIPDKSDIIRLIKTNNIKLISIENTHNFAGGKCIPLEDLKELRKVSIKHNIPIHMDGARLFNASIATGVDVKDICKNVDSVMFCISKGLGAPIGSILSGSKDFIDEARKLRKLLGGNMRQAGIIAATGIYALKHNVERLAIDHKNAKYLADNLKDIKDINIDHNVQSNIVIINIGKSRVAQEEFCDKLLQNGLKVTVLPSGEIRLVFYKGITTENVKQAVKIIKQVLNEI
ncbi:GntG family PLP-dependent aldolase [Clostridioides difficile]|nr:GntG family PLP-dependent aldolase [Clostridioides difficile]